MPSAPALAASTWSAHLVAQKSLVGASCHFASHGRVRVRSNPVPAHYGDMLHTSFIIRPGPCLFASILMGAGKTAPTLHPTGMLPNMYAALPAQRPHMPTFIGGPCAPPGCPRSVQYYTSTHMFSSSQVWWPSMPVYSILQQHSMGVGCLCCLCERQVRTWITPMRTKGAGCISIVAIPIQLERLIPNMMHAHLTSRYCISTSHCGKHLNACADYLQFHEIRHHDMLMVLFIATGGSAQSKHQGPLPWSLCSTGSP